MCKIHNISRIQVHTVDAKYMSPNEFRLESSHNNLSIFESHLLHSLSHTETNKDLPVERNRDKNRSLKSRYMQIYEISTAHCWEKQ